MTIGRLAVFRADASQQIGGGHVMRCLAMADLLAATGWTCAFAVRPGTVETIRALLASAHRILTLDGDPAGEAEQLAAALPGGADLLVADHYGRDAVFEAACRPWAARIMAIDDLADRRHDADLLLDQTPGRDAADYRALVPPGCRLMTGAEWALLRPEFTAARPAALARRRDGVKRLLVSLGATDPRDVTGMVLDALDVCGLDVSVDVTLGSASPNLARARVRASAGGRVTLHENCATMAALMAEADLAVGASGSSALERCCMALPSLAVVVADNQRTIGGWLAAQGAVWSLGEGDALTPAAIADALATLAAQPERLRHMAAAAAAACDGGGLSRLSAVLDWPPARRL